MTSTPVNADPEKGEGESAPPPFEHNHTHRGHGHGHGHHSHIQEARDRLQQFIHPNGKRIHVVESPQDEVNLRRKLERARTEDDEDVEFEIYVSGSAEHLDALRDAHNHHEERRDALRDQHGDVYEQFAGVHYELDALSHELDRVTTHGVSLEAHFTKFGYDAHIKTYDGDSPHGSGTSTPRGSISSDSTAATSKYEKGYGKPLKLFKVPVVRQYFHKGTLWRSSGSEEVQSFELFVDLLYVGIIAINGDSTSEDPTAKSLLRFFITFTLSWKIWNDMTMVVSWFETDDVVQRLSIITLMAMLFGYTTNIDRSFDGTYATLVGFYLAARLFLGAYLVLVAWLVPMIRNIMIWHITVIVVGTALWIGSIQLEYPIRLVLLFPAAFIDMFGHIFYIIFKVFVSKSIPRVKAWMDSKFEFWPAVNIEHRTERMNAFVTLVFGYSVVALLYQTTRNGIDAHYGKAVLGIAQAFCFNWMYFEVDGSNIHVHAIRRHMATSLLWNLAHLPFIMAFVLGSGGLSKLVLAVDTKASHLDDLTPAYREKAEEEIPQGIRWFYCVGYAIALIFMAIIAASHEHKHSPTLRLKKRWRLTGRGSVALILILLPLAHNLNSVQLVAIVTGLIVFALGLELVGASCNREKLCQRSKPCKYIGHCKKSQMRALIRQGKEVDWTTLSDNPTKNTGLCVIN